MRIRIEGSQPDPEVTTPAAFYCFYGDEKIFILLQGTLREDETLKRRKSFKFWKDSSIFSSNFRLSTPGIAVLLLQTFSMPPHP